MIMHDHEKCTIRESHNSVLCRMQKPKMVSNKTRWVLPHVRHPMTLHVWYYVHVNIWRHIQSLFIYYPIIVFHFALVEHGEPDVHAMSRAPKLLWHGVDKIWIKIKKHSSELFICKGRSCRSLQECASSNAFGMLLKWASLSQVKK